MRGIIIGIVIGLTTSIAAGLFLVWRGKQLVDFAQQLPTNYRVGIMTQAFIRALEAYPYRLIHLFSVTFLFTMQIFLIFAYGTITYQSFVFGHGAVKDRLSEIKEYILATSVTPWFFLAVTIMLLPLSYWLCKKLCVEIIVPFAHRELTTIRELVAKCSTRKQFINYVQSERTARTTSDLLKLFKAAQDVIGDEEVKLIRQMIGYISIQPEHDDGNAAILSGKDTAG